MKKSYYRRILLPVFIIAISAMNFIHTEGAENVRSVQIVTLLTCGAGIGLLLASIMKIIQLRRQSNS